MKFLACVSAVTTVVSALSIQAGKRDSPLQVNLEVTGNTDVNATVTDTGSTPLKVFKTGTILDSTLVEKTAVFSGCKLLGCPIDGE